MANQQGAGLAASLAWDWADCKAARSHNLGPEADTNDKGLGPVGFEAEAHAVFRAGHIGMMDITGDVGPLGEGGGRGINASHFAGTFISPEQIASHVSNRPIPRFILELRDERIPAACEHKSCDESIMATRAKMTSKNRQAAASTLD
jgi:hypothetical protein